MKKNKNQYKLSCVNCSQLCRNQDLNLFAQRLLDHQHAGYGEALFNCATIIGQTEAISSLLDGAKLIESPPRIVFKST